MIPDSETLLEVPPRKQAIRVIPAMSRTVNSRPKGTLSMKAWHFWGSGFMISKGPRDFEEI